MKSTQSTLAMLPFAVCSVSAFSDVSGTRRAVMSHTSSTSGGRLAFGLPSNKNHASSCACSTCFTLSAVSPSAAGQFGITKHGAACTCGSCTTVNMKHAATCMCGSCATVKHGASCTCGVCEFDT